MKLKNNEVSPYVKAIYHGISLVLIFIIGISIYVIQERKHRYDHERMPNQEVATLTQQQFDSVDKNAPKDPFIKEFGTGVDKKYYKEFDQIQYQCFYFRRVNGSDDEVFQLCYNPVNNELAVKNHF